LDEPKNYWVSADELARACRFQGIRRIQQLTQDGVLKTEQPDGKGLRKYDFVPSILALLIHYRERAETKYKSGSPELEEEKLAGLRTKRALDNEKLRRAQGDSVDTIYVERVFGAMLGRMKNNLRGLKYSLADALERVEDREERAEIIAERIDRALLELSDYDFAEFRINGGAEYIKELAAAETKGANGDGDEYSN